LQEYNFTHYLNAITNSPRASFNHPKTGNVLHGWGTLSHELRCRNGAPKGGGLPGCSPSKHQNRYLKNTHFVDIILSKVLRDLPFSRNQPLKSADDQYIRILKNKLIKLKNKKIGHCD
jgi:hypothetical protein